MASFKATKPKRALCWICDKRLYAGGRSYVEIEIDGVKRPVHASCEAAIRARGKEDT